MGGYIISQHLFYITASDMEKESPTVISADNTAFIDGRADKILALKTKYLVHWLVGWLDFLYIARFPSLKLCTCIRHQ